ncbi:MAG: hypothetical protein WDZ79_00055 [Candidatus Paceibacterota bacterium]
MSSRLHSKRLFKRIIYSKLALIILILLTALMFKAAWGAYQKMSQSGERAAAAREEKQELLNEQEILSENLQHLETRRGMEEELRKKYSLTKEGEEMVVIVDPEVAGGEVDERDRSVLGEIWDAVVGFFR